MVINYFKIEVIWFIVKIVSKYDQEIPQSQTADNPMAPRGRACIGSILYTHVNKKKATAILALLKMSIDMNML